MRQKCNIEENQKNVVLQNLREESCTEVKSWKAFILVLYNKSKKEQRSNAISEGMCQREEQLLKMVPLDTW